MYEDKIKEIKEYCESNPALSPDDKSISFSQLSLYLSCPYRWYRAYILKEAPYEPSIHTVFGTAFHETIQRWIEIIHSKPSWIGEGFDYKSFLLERMRTLYSSERETSGKDFSNPKELETFYNQGVSILQEVDAGKPDFFDTEKSVLVGCEIPILYKLSEKFYFKGFIDTLIYNKESNSWLIIDYKTSSRGWNAKTKADFNKTAQILLYKYFLAKQFDLTENIDTEYYIVKRMVYQNTDHFPVAKRTQKFTPANGKRSVGKAVSLVNSFISGVALDQGEYRQCKYTPRPSADNCKYCLFKEDCIHSACKKKK